MANYHALDGLYSYFRHGETYAHRMLASVSSPLNREGLALRRCLEESLGKPVYYYLCRFAGHHPVNCPLCGERRKLDAPTASGYEYRCDACRLVAHKTI